MSAPAVIDGLYVHVPFCDGKCGYCAFYSTLYAPGLADEWLRSVEVEAGLVADELGRITPETVYFGGGTPTLLSGVQLGRLAASIRNVLMDRGWEPGGGVEWSVEVNPGSLKGETLDVLRAEGVNRISLGVQSFDAESLAVLGRRHGPAESIEAIAAIRRAGFVNWGLDLIACVPGVDEERWLRTLRQAVSQEPAHLSIYALTSEEGSALAERVRGGALELLDDERQLAMLSLAEETLGEAGYRRYEISNYARPGFECRHHLGCWRGKNYLGLGCAASSRVGSRRWTNRPDLDAYREAAARRERPGRDTESLSPELDAVERLVFGLRMAEGVDPLRIEKETGCGSGLMSAWRDTVRRLVEQGLMLDGGGVWRLTGRGREMADHVAVELMP